MARHEDTVRTGWVVVCRGAAWLVAGSHSAMKTMSPYRCRIQCPNNLLSHLVDVWRSCTLMCYLGRFVHVEGLFRAAGLWLAYDTTQRPARRARLLRMHGGKVDQRRSR